MATTPYLIFSLQDLRYAVRAASVMEIHPLPELTPVEEVPSFIAGLVDLRGKIVPVVDLSIRFGHPFPPCRLSDRLVIMEWKEGLMGIRVHQALEIRSLDGEAVEPPLSFSGRGESRFLEGEARAEEGILMLLDHSRLIDAGIQSESLLSPAAAGPIPLPNFSPGVSPEEREIFHRRAETLRKKISNREDDPSHLPLGVVRLGGECFGIDLSEVREFAPLRNPVPVPCCPPHIAGEMNLRGEIVTLLDLSGFLNLPLRNPRSPGCVIVAADGEGRTGIVVDEILETIHLPNRFVNPIPAPSGTPSDSAIRGTAPYGAGMIALLDLSKFLRLKELVVAAE